MPVTPGENGGGLSRKHILAGHRRLADPIGHGLRRPLPDPPLGPADADRGDHGGAPRRGPGRQGPLHRRQQHVRLAVRQGPARGRSPRLDPVRVHAAPLQPHLPRGGAGDDPPVHRPGRRGHPVEPAGPGRAGRQPHPGAASSRTTRSGTDPFTDYLYSQPTDFDVVERVAEVAAERGVPPAQVALAWLLAQAGGHRAHRRGHQAATPGRRPGRRGAGPRATTRWRGSRSPTSPTRCSGTSRFGSKVRWMYLKSNIRTWPPNRMRTASPLSGATTPRPRPTQPTPKEGGCCVVLPSRPR